MGLISFIQSLSTQTEPDGDSPDDGFTWGSEDHLMGDEDRLMGDE